MLEAEFFKDVTGKMNHLQQISFTKEFCYLVQQTFDIKQVEDVDNVETVELNVV